jgi:XRE family transcriptional regulator, fatty acid utilization regulator
MDGKAMLGHKVRRLRRDLSLTQAQMAEDLGISASYLNLIEHNQRPVTVPILLKLAQIFEIDIQAFAEDDEARVKAELTEVFADPLFDNEEIKGSDLRELANISPNLARGIQTLYKAYRGTRQDLETLAERVADQDQFQNLDMQVFPVEEVRDFFEASHNYFADLEQAAETLWADAELNPDHLYRGLTDHLEKALSVRVKVMPLEVMGSLQRRFDRHARRVLLSEMLPQTARNFQIASQIGYLTQSEAIDAIVAKAGFSNTDAMRLARLGLVNYFAGAVLMPYQRFIEAAKKLRYDIDVLSHRFHASIEQVCHRLTTLQRPGAKGIPFFLIRVDKAGNVSKRYSAGTMHFARYGGACPRWAVHDALRQPDRFLTQFSEMPDGSRYFSIACQIGKPSLGHHLPANEYALGMGCEISHAKDLIYADSYNLGKESKPVPIGVNCRLCPRLDCNQRAFPPLNHRLHIEDHLRGQSPYAFSPVLES